MVTTDTLLSKYLEKNKGLNIKEGLSKNDEHASVLREFCESIRITSVKYHDLRATFITNLLAHGESLARVMAIGGHTQIKTANVYLRKAGVDVQGGTSKLGTVWRLARWVSLVLSRLKMFASNCYQS